MRLTLSGASSQTFFVLFESHNTQRVLRLFNPCSSLFPCDRAVAIYCLSTAGMVYCDRSTRATGEAYHCQSYSLSSARHSKTTSRVLIEPFPLRLLHGVDPDPSTRTESRNPCRQGRSTLKLALAGPDRILRLDAGKHSTCKGPGRAAVTVHRTASDACSHLFRV